MTYIINHKAEDLLHRHKSDHPDFDEESTIAFYVKTTDIQTSDDSSIRRAFVEDHSVSDSKLANFVVCYMGLIVREKASGKWFFIIVPNCYEDDPRPIYYEKISGPHDSYEDALTVVSLTIPFYKSNFSVA